MEWRFQVLGQDLHRENASNIFRRARAQGTFVFGLNGAFTAMGAERLVVAGVVIFAMLTALGGGIMRDMLSGSLPPVTFRDWRYLTVALVSAVVAYIGRRLLSR